MVSANWSQPKSKEVKQLMTHDVIGLFKLIKYFFLFSGSKSEGMVVKQKGLIQLGETKIGKINSKSFKSKNFLHRSTEPIIHAISKLIRAKLYATQEIQDRLSLCLFQTLRSSGEGKIAQGSDTGGWLFLPFG